MPPRKAAATTEPAEGVRRSSRIKDLPKPVVTAPKPRTKKGEGAKSKKRKAEEVEKGDAAEGDKPASKKAKPSSKPPSATKPASKASNKPSSKVSNKPGSRAGSKKPTSKAKGSGEGKENAAGAQPIAEDPEGEAAAERAAENGA